MAQQRRPDGRFQCSRQPSTRIRKLRACSRAIAERQSTTLWPGSEPSLRWGDLEASSVKLGVVLRLLNAAGRDAFDVFQVVPNYPTGNGRVNFALMASPSRGASRPAAPQVLVEVRPFSENLDGGRHEHRMAALCSRLDVSLGCSPTDGVGCSCSRHPTPRRAEIALTRWTLPETPLRHRKD